MLPSHLSSRDGFANENRGGLSRARWPTLGLQRHPVTERDDSILTVERPHCHKQIAALSAYNRVGQGQVGPFTTLAGQVPSIRYLRTATPIDLGISSTDGAHLLSVRSEVTPRLTAPEWQVTP